MSTCERIRDGVLIPIEYYAKEISATSLRPKRAVGMRTCTRSAPVLVSDRVLAKPRVEVRGVEIRESPLMSCGLEGGASIEHAT